MIADYVWQDPNISLMCGLAMTATAVSLTMVSLKSLDLHKSVIATRIMTSAVLDDIRVTAIKAKKLVDSVGPEGHMMGYCIGEAVCQTGSPLAIYPIAKSKLDNRLSIVLKSGV